MIFPDEVLWVYWLRSRVWKVKLIFFIAKKCFIIFFSFFFILLFQSHDLGHRFDEIFWIGSTLISVTTDLSWPIFYVFFTPSQNPNIFFYTKNSLIVWRSMSIEASLLLYYIKIYLFHSTSLPFSPFEPSLGSSEMKFGTKIKSYTRIKDQIKKIVIN